MSSENSMEQSVLDSYVPSQEEREKTELILDIFDECEKNGVKISILGGLGLDALYGKLTRDHGDFDIIVPKKNEQKFVEIIRNKGFKLSKAIYEPKEYKMKYLKGDCLLEYTTDDQLFFFSGASRAELFPEEVNGKLLRRGIRSPTLDGHKWMIKTGNELAKTKGWGNYKHRENQNLLVKLLEKKSYITKDNI